MEIRRAHLGDERAIAEDWVLDTNVRGRRFYESANWTPDGAVKVDKRDGFELREVRYRRLLQ